MPNKSSKPSKTKPTHLPRESIDQITEPMGRFFRIETVSGAVLLLFVAAALVVSNSSWAEIYLHFWEIPVGFQFDSFELSRSLKEWINDAGMTLFFFLVALELKREIVLGELNNPRIAALSIAAATGGMLIPACIYLLFQFGQPGEAGWGTVMATDTAFVIGCLALLGSRIPHNLRVFMLSLAIVDDIGAILVVAIGYNEHIVWGALALAILGFCLVAIMARVGVRIFPVFFFVGACIWLAVDASGIHPTITGVILGLMTPARRWVNDRRLYGLLNQVVAHPAGKDSSDDTKDRETLQVAEIAARESISPLERLEIGLHPWVGLVIIPLFALANAGLSLTQSNQELGITLAIIIGFTIGKPLGILSFCWIALRSGIATSPPDLSWRLIAGGSLLAGIGFTMALFIANLAFPENLLSSAKIGIFTASMISATTGIALLMWQPSKSKISKKE